MSVGTRRGPLAGLRVLSFSAGSPGALLGMLLCDNGAEVVKIGRSTSGDEAAEGLCMPWGRGQRSVALDPDDADDRRVVAELASSADVVIVTDGQDQVSDFGLLLTDVRRSNPAVVWCTLLDEPGQPSDGWGSDYTLAVARLGVMGASPGYRDGPIFPGHPSVLHATTMVAFVSLLAAVRRRVATGVGGTASGSFSDGVLAVSAMNWWSERGRSVYKAKDRTGRLDFGSHRLLIGVYECADGALVQIHTGAAGAFDRAMAVFGLDGVVSHAEGPVQTTTPLSEADQQAVRERLPAIFKTRPAASWLERLWKADVACLPLQEPGRALEDDQVRHAGAALTSAGSSTTVTVVGGVTIFSATPTNIELGVSDFGADTAAVRESGWLCPGFGHRSPVGRPDLDATRSAQDAPLAGITVLELGGWFASPYGNRLLSDLGADVIKFEPLTGDPIRQMPDPAEGALRGKRSVAIDLKQEAAREILAEAFRRSDVVQHNLRPGVAERLGIDYTSVRAAHPDVIYSYSPGFGAHGPKAELQSFAPLMSGFVGVNVMSAGPGNPPNGAFGNEDSYGGMLQAASILMAIIHRDRTGEGQYVETPQLHASLLFSSEWYLVDGQPRSALPLLDSEQTGWSPTNRIYECLDGWIAVACRSESQVRGLLDMLGIDEPWEVARGGAGAELAGLIQGALYLNPADQWVELLRARAVPCVQVAEGSWLQEFLQDDENVASGRVLDLAHPLHGHVRVIGPLSSFGTAPLPRRARSPLLGEDTLDVLGEMISTELLRRCLDEGIVVATTAPVATDVDSD